MSQMGKCMQCNAQIMVQDSDGRWNSFKPNYREIDLVFSCGHKTRVQVCSTCAESPDFEKINDCILEEGSAAFGSDEDKQAFQTRKLNERVASFRVYRVGEKRIS